jgi:hypothetical protein
MPPPTSVLLPATAEVSERVTTRELAIVVAQNDAGIKTNAGIRTNVGIRTNTGIRTSGYKNKKQDTPIKPDTNTSIVTFFCPTRFLKNRLHAALRRFLLLGWLELGPIILLPLLIP